MLAACRQAVLVAGLLAFVGAPTAEAENKCYGDKLKAACKKASCKAGLEAKEAGYGTPPSATNIAKCESKFSATYAKAEAKGDCLFTGDAAAKEAMVDAFVIDLDAELNVPSGTTPSKCEADKIKAAAKKASCKCDLEAKQASRDGLPPAPPAASGKRWSSPRAATHSAAPARSSI